MRAPRLLAASTAGACLLLLTGCEKPSPIVSIVSGGAFEHSEASYFCYEGQDPAKEPGSEGGCTVREGQPPELLRALPGEQVGVDVDRELAHAGWVVVARPQGAPAEEGQASGVQESHYFTFDAQFPDGGRPLDLEVRMLAEKKADARPVGIWRFVLAPRT